MVTEAPGRVAHSHRNLLAVQLVRIGYCVSHNRPPVRILRPAGIGTLVSEVSLWMTMLPFPVIWKVSAMNEVHGEGANASAVPVTVTSCFCRDTTPSKYSSDCPDNCP